MKRERKEKREIERDMGLSGAFAGGKWLEELIASDGERRRLPKQLEHFQGGAKKNSWTLMPLLVLSFCYSRVEK